VAGGMLRIRDLASKNGTFLNRDQTRTGERICKRRHRPSRRLGHPNRIGSGHGSNPAASLETQDVRTETIDHAGHSHEKTKVDQPTSAVASQQAAGDSGRGGHSTSL